MSKKSGDAPGSPSGHHDVIGIVILLFAVVLLVAQWTFVPNDVSFVTTRVNNPPANWLGTPGAWTA
jgi:hypothetical protein